MLCEVRRKVSAVEFLCAMHSSEFFQKCPLLDHKIKPDFKGIALWSDLHNCMSLCNIAHSLFSGDCSAFCGQSSFQ